MRLGGTQSLTFSLRDGLVRLALASLLLRALIPAGFMAAPVAEGWWLQLCPAGMTVSSYRALTADALASAHGAHHPSHSYIGEDSSHSNHASHGDGEPDAACGLGAGFAAIAPELDVAPLNQTALIHRLRHTYRAPHLRPPVRTNGVRAPPHSSLNLI